MKQILEEWDKGITRVCESAIESCEDWKPWKTVDVAYSNVPNYLNSASPEYAAFDPSDPTDYEEEVIDIVYDYIDYKLAQLAPDYDVTPEDLGVYEDSISFSHSFLRR